MRYLTAFILAASAALGRAEPYAYIERWATGTLTTGEEFESWRIHVVVPDGDDWVASSIDGWLTGGPTWYEDPTGVTPRPDLFPEYPDAEFATYWTTPHLYPNSDLVDGVGMTADLVLEPTYLDLGGWFDTTFDTDGDYVVWQGTVLNPVADTYGTIEFAYATHPEPFVEYLTFLIPEPGSGLLLLAPGACLLRRR